MERDPQVVIDEFDSKLKQDGKLILTYLPLGLRTKDRPSPMPSDQDLIAYMSSNLLNRQPGQAISPLRMVAGYIDKFESKAVEGAWRNQVDPRFSILCDTTFSGWYAVPSRVLVSIEELLYGLNPIGRLGQRALQREGFSLSAAELAGVHLQMAQYLRILQQNPSGIAIIDDVMQSSSEMLMAQRQAVEGIGLEAELATRIVRIGAERYKKLYTMLTDLSHPWCGFYPTPGVG